MKTQSIQIIKSNKRSDDFEYSVVITENGSSTTHQVIVPEAYWKQFSEKYPEPKDLVEASFMFLLEREPKESILSEFELPIIKTYFPEYEDVIRA